jgi:hypothetical protein
MALLTVEGVYEHGKVELAETPTDAPTRARVLVTFLPLNGEQESELDPRQGEGQRKQAAQRLLSRLEQGIDFGGPPYPKREELYDRWERFTSGDD